MYTSVLSCIMKSLTIQKKSCLKGNSYDCRNTYNVDFHCGGRFPRARLQPLPSRSSVQGLQFLLIPLESPPPFQSTDTAVNMNIIKFIFLISYTFDLINCTKTFSNYEFVSSTSNGYKPKLS